MRALPIMWDDIRKESHKDEGVRKIKEDLRSEKKKGNENKKAFSVCDDCLMYAEWSVILES